MQVGLQPYTIREIPESLPSKLERIARAGYDGVELSVDDDTDAVHDALVANDLSVTSVSADVDRLETDPDGLADTCEAFGTDHVVIMWLDEDHWTSSEAVDDTATLLDELADRLAERGIDLHYHNHDHEFTDLGATTGYEAFVEATDAVNLELDLGWAGSGGRDPAVLLERIGERVSLVHFKDMHFESRQFATFGEGDLDLEATVEAARNAGVEWGIVENDEPNDPVAEAGHASVVLDQFTGHYC